jgi:transcriptional regulator with XRE-family HTH domain
MRAKRPVPKGAVWWNRAEGHPCLRFFGAELRHQRWDVRGWSLEDLHQASGLCRSFLCELENGKAAPTEEAILELEAALEMEIGGLMELVKRRWMRWVSEQGQRSGLSGWLGTQARHIRRALKRRALAEWLGAWLALPEGFWSLEPVLES